MRQFTVVAKKINLVTFVEYPCLNTKLVTVPHSIAYAGHGMEAQPLWCHAVHGTTFWAQL